MSSPSILDTAEYRKLALIAAGVDPSNIPAILDTATWRHLMLAALYAISSGGGYISGVVDTYNDLPVTVGTPALNTVYLVRFASGVWLINRKPGGLYVRIANNGTLDDWEYLSAFPEVQSDLRWRVYNETDPTKEVALDVSNVLTGTLRTLQVPDASGRIQIEGQPIGNVTPNAGTFTNLVANTELQLPSAAPSSPSSGDLYRISDTLRYRDSSNTERSLAPQSQSFDFYYASGPSGATGGSGSNWVWNIPSWSTMQIITIICAGGGGGSGRVSASGTTASGGGAGGSGAYGTLTTRITGGDQIEVLVGLGGAGGAAVGTAAANGNAGLDGGNTSVRWVTPNLVLRLGSAFGRGGGGPAGTVALAGNGAAGLVGTTSTILGSTGSGIAGYAGSLSAQPTGGNNGNSTQSGRAGGSISATPTAFNGGLNSGASFMDVRESFLLPNLVPRIGTGAAGGNASITGNGTAGGNAAIGGGGGGGGAALVGFLSGAGGNGGDGFVRIICF